jgi:hypothetical protein
VGSDDGLVQLTRDGGRTWTNVTPAGLSLGLSNELEVSPHDPATVYLAFRTDRLGDYTPHAFRSTDYGRTWTRITTGLRPGEPVRVVREDPERRGLLYAGTETGVYVSFDAGASWQSLSRNLPAVPITDLELRHGDLYIATEGRAFWALDDLSALRQLTREVVSQPVHLFAPRPALLAGGPAAPTTSAGRNPPFGANIYFWLASAPDSATAGKLEILDASGSRVLRSYTRATGATPAPTGGGGGGPGGGAPRTTFEAKAGLNAFQWDLRAEPPTRLPGNINVWGGPTNGYRVAPGRYQVRLTIGATAQTQPLEVRNDPRLAMSPAEVAARDTISRAIVARLTEIHDALLRVRDVKEQVTGFVERAKDVPTAAAIAARGKEIGTKVDSVAPKLSTKAANGQDVINYRNGINAQYAFLLGNIEQNDVLTQPARERFAELERLWGALRQEIDAIEQQDVPAFNKLLQDAGLTGVIVPKPKPNVAM